MKETNELFAEDFKAEPYWWRSPMPVHQVDPEELPKEADVLIVGSGYTGLNAGLQTARENLSTLILDAKAIGWGCSSRNGGQVSPGVKVSYDLLSRRYGEKMADRIVDEGKASLEYMHELVREENLDCDFREVGRFQGAFRKSHYELLERECRNPKPGESSDAYLVPKSEMASELGTDAYHGGIVYPNHCSIDVGKYLGSLAASVEKAGAVIMGNCAVQRLERTGSGFSVETPFGIVRAGKVILATNGYTTGLFSWHRKRIIPIDSYIIATEQIDRGIMDKIMPKDRVLSDTRQIIFYYRPSPDRTRILFGGRLSLIEADARKSAVKLHRELVRLFPELENIQVSRSWAGTVGFSFDHLMHTGQDSGLYYSMGYCGSGVAMSSYLGMRIGRLAAGLDKVGSVFDSIEFPSRPYYFGHPWFLAPILYSCRMYDRFVTGAWLKVR